MCLPRHACCPFPTFLPHSQGSFMSHLVSWCMLLSTRRYLPTPDRPSLASADFLPHVLPSSTTPTFIPWAGAGHCLEAGDLVMGGWVGDAFPLLLPRHPFYPTAQAQLVCCQAGPLPRLLLAWAREPSQPCMWRTCLCHTHTFEFVVDSCSCVYYLCLCCCSPCWWAFYLLCVLP